MKVIITGCAGFIGAAFTRQMLARGATVIGLDDLSRAGSTENLAWIQEFGGRLTFIHADIRNAEQMNAMVREHADAIALVHLAAQTAVTGSVTNPRHDFESNALGTLNMLEAVRLSGTAKMAFLFASTNKVYGGIEHEPIELHDQQYSYAQLPLGVSEDCPLDFHSPYGCSKGAADQYVRDYARIYDIPTVVFRQSCIYGPRQFGLEEQGWVAWFAIAAATAAPITVYGDGFQVRDLLWIDDLCDLYEQAIARIDQIKGRVYNVGGGAANRISVRQVLDKLSNLRGRAIPRQFSDWRPGDQRIFVADVRRVSADLAWAPRTSTDEGIKRLFDWVNASKPVLERVLGMARA